MGVNRINNRSQPNIDKKVTILIDRTASGDAEAFGELYNIFVERIYRYLFYQVRDKMTAEDILQETFVKVWRAIRSSKVSSQTFISWLYRIAHNQLVDTIRRNYRRLSTVEKVKNSYDIEVPEHMFDAEQRDLLKVVDTLPQMQKQVIILKFIEGLSNSEIGQVIGKSRGAIRILQMRALASLRQQLEADSRVRPK